MKISQFKKYLKQQEIDHASLFNISFSTSDPSVKYFTGFECEHGTLIIPKSRREIFYIPQMEVSRAKGSRMNVKPLAKDFHEIFSNVNSKVMGVNRKKIPDYYVSKLRKETGARIVDVGKKIRELRKKKIYL